ncbi:Cytochrome P450 76AD1 [Euphorbia peplus]|nr:Cytochrome P450 76AD1 [Euphorbia peplus]
MVTFIYVLSVVIGLVLIRVVSSYFSSKIKNLPPGPFPYPIVGNMFQLGIKPHKTLANLSKIHGPLMSLKLGQLQTIVISSPSLAKQIFQTHDHNLTFFDRIVSKTVRVHNHHHFSIVYLPYGPLWRNLRKATNSYLVSNHKLDATQHIVANKVNQLLSHVKKCSLSGTPLEFDKIAFETLLDILSVLMFSLDLADSTCDTVREFKDLLKCIGEEVTALNLVDFFPILDHVYPQLMRHRLGVYVGRLFDLFDHIFDERLLARKEKTYISTNDMLDSLLSMNKRSKKCIDRNAIKHLFMILLVVGADTTANPLQWAMVELLTNPETIRKARGEIEQVIGRDIMIKESDVAQLPYLRAIIKETFRMCPGMPLAIRMLQLVLGSLIQHFDWKLEDGVTPESFDMNARIGAVINKPPLLRVIPVQVTH